MLLTDFDRSRDALDILRRVTMRVMCRWCEEMFIRTEITADVCPHCHREGAVQ